MLPDTFSASTHSVAHVPCHATPSEAWVLAPLIAGQPFYRIGRWIGSRFQFPRPKVPQAITTTLPASPAAVLIHGTDGSVSTLCLDLDTSKALKSVVDTDAARLRTLLYECGVIFVEDFSPSGGRHLYIPLQQPLSASEARELVEALAFTAPSLDPSPHQNITDGCIRVPGSAHKSGGHQTLITNLAAAYHIMRRRNSAAALQRLRAALAPELRRRRELKEKLIKTAARAQTAGKAPMPETAGSESPLRRTARTGVYETARYKSPSEARLAVLNHLVTCGWSLEQVRSELGSQFPGLAALYGNAAKQARLLDREWANATAWIQKNPSTRRGERPALINDTSLPKPTGGASKPSSAAIHQLVNDLENVLYAVLDHRLKERGREGLSLRLMLRAFLGYMRTKETNILDVGCRTLAVALGKHHATVARLLPVLAANTEGIVTKIEEAHYKTADVYLLELPEQFQQLAQELSWRKGRIHGVRPIFRALGDPAALVYEAIERGRHSPTTADIHRSTGLSRNAAGKALTEMASLGMIHRDGGRWKITAASNLTQLAIRLGVMDDVQEHIRRNRKERAAWHAWLDRHKLSEPLQEEDLYEAERDQYWLPPSEEGPYLSSLWTAA